MRSAPSRVLPLLVALLVLTSTTVAVAKRCPKLCRSDVKSCGKR